MNSRDFCQHGQALNACGKCTAYALQLGQARVRERPRYPLLSKLLRMLTCQMRGQHNRRWNPDDVDTYCRTCGRNMDAFDRGKVHELALLLRLSEDGRLKLHHVVYDEQDALHHTAHMIVWMREPTLMERSTIEACTRSTSGGAVGPVTLVT